jgi:hypothetical protein
MLAYQFQARVWLLEELLTYTMRVQLLWIVMRGSCHVESLYDLDDLIYGPFVSLDQFAVEI